MNRNSMKGKTGFNRILGAVLYSKNGYLSAWKDEAAFRQIIFLSIIGFIGALFVSDSKQDFFILIVPIVICIIVELLNSAIENTVDRISIEFDDLAKKAKDMASAAQMTAQVFLFGTWFVFLFF